ncbi:MAG TPA: riboflavin synthase [Cytophagaceae bacterium]|jgi:riboflavin synthase|nr:riboflavin synthase [Cytophagaceae bacterium]
MFTGIIESVGIISGLVTDRNNIDFFITSSLSPELKVDQSLAHNGVCLTVVDIKNDTYKVTAIHETLNKTNLGYLKTGDYVNLERSMPANGRFDGHIVQGHVDQTAICKGIIDEEGSKIFTFEYDDSKGNITVEKGSICINGISLTVVNSKRNSFSVAVIPYTFEKTNMKFIKISDIVNLEFDILGKYISRLLKNRE